MKTVALLYFQSPQQSDEPGLYHTHAYLFLFLVNLLKRFTWDFQILKAEHQMNGLEHTMAQL